MHALSKQLFHPTASPLTPPHACYILPLHSGMPCLNHSLNSSFIQHLSNCICTPSTSCMLSLNSFIQVHHHDSTSCMLSLNSFIQVLHHDSTSCMLSLNSFIQLHHHDSTSCMLSLNSFIQVHHHDPTSCMLSSFHPSASPLHPMHEQTWTANSTLKNIHYQISSPLAQEISRFKYWLHE
jgi:hypothetical protein